MVYYIHYEVIFSMKELTCSFSGHRQIYLLHKESLPILLSKTLDELISSGITTFQSGGAIGFDLLAAALVITKRARNPEIKLRMLLPCRDQAARWPAKTRRAYNNILAAADDVTYISDKYDQFCMYARNRALVDSADILLCYMTRKNSGTAYTANYAAEKNLRTINLFELL